MVLNSERLDMTKLKIKPRPIIAMCAIGVWAILILIIRHSRQNAEAAMDKINAQITDVRYDIDSIRIALPRQVSDSLAFNPVYQEILQNRAYIDSLRTTNEELINRAYNIAYRNSIFAVPHRNESVFRNYRDIKGISPIAWKYYANDKKIRAYDKLTRENPNLRRAIQSHFDSISNIKISQLQNKMDSLLDEKHKQIIQR